MIRFSIISYEELQGTSKRGTSQEASQRLHGLSERQTRRVQEQPQQKEKPQRRVGDHGPQAQGTDECPIQRRDEGLEDQDGLIR